MATGFLWAHPFESTLDKEIWRMHAEGKSLRAIAEELKAQQKELSKDKVHAVVRALRSEMMGHNGGKITVQLSATDFIKAKVKRR